MTRRTDDRLVWSSERGDQRARDRKGSGPSAPGSAPRDGIVRVRRETQGRKGKGVTTITGVPLRDAELRELAAELKRQCGSGGTVKDGVIEIQGDHRDQVVPLLEARGWVVKRAGG
jgi:translation initiation factor 1